MRGLLIVVGVVLAAACTPAMPSSTAAGGQIDVLDFLIGEAALWPRHGTQDQDQIVDHARRELCWTKYGNSRMFECWRWDDQWIFHAVDHGLDGYSGQSYSFTDGRWLPRFIPASATAAASWTLDVADNRVVWFDALCNVDPSRSHRFPYRLRAFVVTQVYDGFDLGVRDNLVMEYQSYDPASPTRPGPTERFSFGRGAGWYWWQRGQSQAIFNQLGGPATQIDRKVWCGAFRSAAAR
jgi:hypothetical protein